MQELTGEVTEWPKVQHWKCCVRQKCTAGSNPALSAIRRVRCAHLRMAGHGVKAANAANALSLSKGLSVNWCGYILRCANDSYDVGHPNDTNRGLLRHAAGRGPNTPPSTIQI